jgi:hypothetical protein
MTLLFDIRTSEKEKTPDLVERSGGGRARNQLNSMTYARMRDRPSVAPVGVAVVIVIRMDCVVVEIMCGGSGIVVRLSTV